MFIVVALPGGIVAALGVRDVVACAGTSRVRGGGTQLVLGLRPARVETEHTRENPVMAGSCIE